MGFGKRGGGKGGEAGVAFDAAATFAPGTGRAARGAVVTTLTLAGVFAVSLAVAGLVDGFTMREALGVATIASLPAIWILLVLGYGEPPDSPDLRGARLETRFIAAHPAVAGIGGVIGFAWFVAGQDASLWSVLASSREIYGMHGMDRLTASAGASAIESGGPLIYEALDEFITGVAVAALLWSGLLRLRASGR
jgi:hypothetical protein